MSSERTDGNPFRILANLISAADKQSVVRERDILPFQTKNGWMQRISTE